MTETDQPASTTPPAEPSLPVPGRPWIKIVALSVVLLVCGGAIGAGLTATIMKRRADQLRQNPELLSDKTVARAAHDLNLTKEQADEVAKIFHDTRKEAQEMRQRNRAEAQTLFRGLQDNVSKVLKPDQQKAWEDWFRKAREEAFRNRPGGPPPGMRPRGSGDPNQPSHSNRERRRENGDAVRQGGEPSDFQPVAIEKPEAKPAPAPDGIPEHHVAPPPDTTPPPPPSQ